MKRKKRPSRPTPSSLKSPRGTEPLPGTASRHFHLQRDPFSTLALRDPDLRHFVGRSSLIQRATSAILSLSNLGLAGEEGIGKSSLLRLLGSRVPKDFRRVELSVPLDDASFLLSELLGEISPGRAPSSGGGKGTPSRKELLAALRSLLTDSPKPFVVFLDDLEKIKGDRNRHLTRSERTLQLLHELKPLLEIPNACFVVSLQEEFHSKVADVVGERGDPTVLGLFTDILHVEKFTDGEMRGILSERLKSAGFPGEPGEFLEAEALTLALFMAGGNPRRFLYLLSRAMYKSFARQGTRLSFQDLFEALNEHLKLDLAGKKLLYFLAKSGRAMPSNPDFQSFMGLDGVSLSRRLDALVKVRLAEVVDHAEGSKIYGLSRSKPSSSPWAGESPARGEITYTLSGENSGEGET